MTRYIDAEKFAKRIMNKWHTSDKVAERLIRETITDIVTPILIDTPTEDVEPIKHAHWIGKPISGFSNVRCSNCLNLFTENSGKWDFCPCCGAKMDMESD